MKKLTENDVTGCVLIGNDNERYRYFAAVIGISKDGHHIVYSFDKLVKCFQVENDWSLEEAIEWVETNVICALPYYGDYAPEVHDVSHIKITNRKYRPIQLVREEANG